MNRDYGARIAVELYGVHRRKTAGIGSVAKKVAPYALAAGIPLATIGGVLGRKPAIQSNLKNLMQSKGTLREKDETAGIPENALNTADLIHSHLRERGIDPASLRIAVDAAPGTGKTTLSRAMAQQMGLQHYGLDWLPNNKLHSIMGGGHLETMPRAPRAGEILEHFNLLRAYDPELFDVAVHIQKDPETVKRQILERGRSAGVSTFLDYNKSMAVGRKAFDTLAGDMIDLGNGAMMKVRPKDGWGTEKMDEDLQAMGVDPTGLSRHEKLLSLTAGQRQTGSGWTPYAKNPFTPGETAAALGSIPLGIGAALAAKKWLR